LPDDLLEAVFAEQLVFLVFELLAELAISSAADDVAKRGRQRRVLTRSVRAIRRPGSSSMSRMRSTLR
jgi:hypothetical protein